MSLLVPAHPGSPGQRAVRQQYVFVMCGRLCDWFQTNTRCNYEHFSALLNAIIKFFVIEGDIINSVQKFPALLALKSDSASGGSVGTATAAAAAAGRGDCALMQIVV